MHSEIVRCFPVIAFKERHNFPISDLRVLAVTDLQNMGALKARNSFAAPNGGLNIVYEWTELGFRLMRQWQILNADREAELRAQIASVPVNSFPPGHLLVHPDDTMPTGAKEKSQPEKSGDTRSA